VTAGDEAIRIGQYPVVAKRAADRATFLVEVAFRVVTDKLTVLTDYFELE
jgi:hypothetical protein